MTDRKADVMTEILDRPPDEPDGNDQAAKPDDDTEIVTDVDLLDTPDPSSTRTTIEDADGDDA